MSTARSYHTGTLLPDGHVLVTGGMGLSGGFAISSAELYDPSTSTFTSTGSMSSARTFQTATLLPNGTVLIAGGFNSCNTCAALRSAESYDPRTGTWTYTGSMANARAGHTATLLPSRQVLAAGGASNYIPVASAELYTPGAGR